MDCEEINVSAPWGHLAVKIWGNQKNPAVLMFHGILDNVGTFDRIMPFLPRNYYYVGVDFPGHGKSSHWPSKSIINTLDHLLVYEVIAKYFKRQKYIIIGHSYGGQLAYFYTQLYPDRVEKLIILDVLFLVPIAINEIKQHLLFIHKSYFATMNKLENGKAPEYSYEEALDKLIANRIYGVITQEAAKPILNRMIITHDNGKVSFSVDQRLKFFLNPLFNYGSMYEFIITNPVECPVLVILSSEFKEQRDVFKTTIELYRSRKNMKVIDVQGDHNIHNTDPTKIAPLITSFLNNKSKL